MKTSCEETDGRFLKLGNTLDGPFKFFSLMSTEKNGTRQRYVEFWSSGVCRPYRVQSGNNLFSV
jgi:hypothetical protein